MNKKCIWIVNNYASTPSTGVGGRHYYLGEELAKQGHEVYVIASSYTHLLREPKHIKNDFFIEKLALNFSYIWVKLPTYEGAHSSQRIINEFLFSFKIIGLKNKIKTPDVIMHSTPALLTYYGSYHLCRYYKIPYVLDVRDFWPKTLIELGGYSKNHPFIRLLQYTEDKAYKNATKVFANAFNGVSHMISRGMNKSKFSWIPNGISLSEADNKEQLASEVIAQIPKDKFIVGYTGTIGVANAINFLIDAIPLIENKDNIHFIIVGDGKEKVNIVNSAKNSTIENITFIPQIPKRQVQSMIDFFDVCYIGWQKHKMYELGIAAQKLPEYLYSAKPIIHSYSGNGDFVAQAKAGITIEAENPFAIAKAIDDIYEMTIEQRNMMGQNGREFALNNFDYAKIAKKLSTILFEA